MCNCEPLKIRNRCTIQCRQREQRFEGHKSGQSFKIFNAFAVSFLSIFNKPIIKCLLSPSMMTDQDLSINLCLNTPQFLHMNMWMNKNKRSYSVNNKHYKSTRWLSQLTFLFEVRTVRFPGPNILAIWEAAVLAFVLLFLGRIGL